MKHLFKAVFLCSLMSISMAVRSDDDTLDASETELLGFAQATQNTSVQSSSDAQIFKEFLGATYGEIINDAQFGQGIDDLLLVLNSDDKWKGTPNLEGYVYRLLKRAVLRNKKMNAPQKQNDKIAEALGTAIALWTPGPIKGSMLPQLNTDFYTQLSADEQKLADNKEKDAAKKIAEAEKAQKEKEKAAAAAQKLTDEQAKKAAAAELAKSAQQQKSTPRKQDAAPMARRQQDKITYRVASGLAQAPDANPAPVATPSATSNVAPAKAVLADVVAPIADSVPAPKRRRAPRKITPVGLPASTINDSSAAGDADTSASSDSV